MKTIVTLVHLMPGAGRDWDAVMRRRLSAVRQQPGWVGGQLLRPVDKENGRVDRWHMENSGGLGSMAR